PSREVRTRTDQPGAADVEIIHRGKRVVDRDWAALEHRQHLRAVVAHRAGGLPSGSPSTSAPASQARYCRTFDAGVRRVRADSGADASSATEPSSNPGYARSAIGARPRAPFS